MGRKSKKIRIGNIDFKYKGIVKRDEVKNLSYKTLRQCYNRPSDTKIDIYDEWNKFLNNNCK